MFTKLHCEVTVTSSVTQSWAERGGRERDRDKGGEGETETSFRGKKTFAAVSDTTSRPPIMCVCVCVSVTECAGGRQAAKCFTQNCQKNAWLAV